MKVNGITDIGLIRKKNQDSYASLNNRDGDYLILVCDGIGGNKAGEIASRLVCSHFERVFPEENFLSIKEAKEFVYRELISANRQVYALSSQIERYQGMGTTVTGFFLSHLGNFVFNVGDSRCYGFKASEMLPLTQDDSYVAAMMRAGEMSAEEAAVHPKRHHLTKAVGVLEKVDFNLVDFEKMDYYLACSDGLHSYVTDAEIKEIVLHPDLSNAHKVERLKELALGKGGYDNITLVLVENDG